jgi:hypothetical protein
MKLAKYILAVVALTGALTLSAKADLMFLGAVDFNNGPNSPAANLAALQAFTEDATGFVLCNNAENLNGADTTLTVMPGEFLVAHYGKGSGGTGKGGSLEFFQVINGETSVTVPGSPNAGDTFATGGLSSVRGFCPPGTTPDSGTTATLLGGALAGLGLVRRYLKR